MKNIFIAGFAFLVILFSVNVMPVSAQDTVKKATAVKKPIAKPEAIDPKTGKSSIPTNPKTGKPYTKYGYGSYAGTYKQANTADSLKKAAASKGVAIPAVDSPAVTVPVDKSLNGQYKYLLSKVYNYQQPLVAALWKNVIDSLNTNNRKLLDAQTKATAQDKTINDLKADATAKEAAVSNADEISLLGITMSKNAYSLIMWGLVIAFAVIAGIVIARSGSLKHEATHRTALYNELEEEFKAYKAKAIDKEKKLARELQTERNKVDELMGRG